MDPLEILEGAAIVGLVAVVVRQIGKAGSVLGPGASPQAIGNTLGTATGNAANAAATIGAQTIVSASGTILSAAGNTFNSAVGATSQAPPATYVVGTDICTDIAYWRSTLTPASTLDQIVQFFAPPDPNDWSQFRAFEQGTGGFDPGGTPPSCWYGPYGREGY